MFDIGLIELLLIGIVGLLVLGPERLPVAIRQSALYMGRLKRMYRSVKADIEKEVGADDIRRQLHNEEIMQSISAGKDQLSSVVDTVHTETSISASSPNNTRAKTNDGSSSNKSISEHE